MQSPLMCEADAMEYLGCDKKGLQSYIREGRLSWVKRTRTFARKQVERLAEEIEKEIMPDDGTDLERKAEAMDCFDGFRTTPTMG